MPPTPIPLSPAPFDVDWASRSGNSQPVLREIDFLIRQSRRKRTQFAKATAAVVALGAILAWAIPAATQTEVYQSPAATRQMVTLADGSTVELSTGTILKTDFRYGRRVAELTKGEAFFSIAKDPLHPFVVTTPEGVVRVLGTRFNVRVDAQSQVTLFDGKVQVEAAGKPVVLAPHDVAVLTSTGPQVRSLSANELNSVQAWREGRLSLAYLTLGESVKRMAEFNGCKIHVDPALAGVRMGGSCALDDLPAFLNFIANAHPLEVTKAADGSYVIAPK